MQKAKAMKTLVRGAIVVAALALAQACVIETGGDSSLTVANDSDYVLLELHVAEIDDPTWGPNLIPEALYPGEQVEIILDCGDYDVLIVDELGASCELYDLDLCFDDAIWVIDNFTLSTCSF